MVRFAGTTEILPRAVKVRATSVARSGSIGVRRSNALPALKLRHLWRLGAWRGRDARLLRRQVTARFRIRSTQGEAGVLSRRAILHRAATVGASLLALAGCSGMAANGPRFDASELSLNPTLLVATTRKAVNGGLARPWFGTERSSTMTIARAKLTPPDDGRFSLASVGLADWRINAVEPVSNGDDLLIRATSGRNVLIYVHGFNHSFESAALDAARLSDGIKFNGETALFSWPSKGKLMDYGYDRESAMWSRDALEQIIEDLVVSPTVGRVNVVAHSIGTMLAMEALRSLCARRGEEAASRIGAIIFASPDIDVDVFTSSIKHIGPLAAKITLITATNDRALAVSGWLNGGITRVGASEKSRLETLCLRVIDATHEGWGIINHDLFMSDAAVRQAIREVIGGMPSFAPAVLRS